MIASVLCLLQETSLSLEARSSRIAQEEDLTMGALILEESANEIFGSWLFLSLDVAIMIELVLLSPSRSSYSP